MFYASSAGLAEDMIYCSHMTLGCNWEPAQTAAGPGQGTNRNCFSYEQGGALRGGLGDWRVMEVRHRWEDVISSHEESRSHQRPQPPWVCGPPWVYRPLWMCGLAFLGLSPTSSHSSACISPPSSSSLRGAEGSTGKEDKITVGLLWLSQKKKK